MRPDAGAPCVLCWLQSRPAVLLSVAVAVFALVLSASFVGLLL